MPVLVVAEHDHKSLKPVTANAVTAARALDADVHLFLAGFEAADATAQAAAIDGVTKVLHAENEAYAAQLPEALAALVAKLGPNYTHIVAPATSFGKNLLPRVAALLDMQQVSDVMEIVDPTTFRRPVYAGNAVATVKSAQAINLLTIRPTNFPPADTGSGAAAVEAIDELPQAIAARFVEQELTVSERPELGGAKIVVSGGRGLGSKENFQLIEQLADKLGGAVGASRAAVDAGYAPNDYQVGQTGKIVAPDLYIAIGISGAIQHLAGMKDAKTIVAINKDPDAPIFGIADYGLVGDLFAITKELNEKL
jgi:electron transfer flavoprotein alpha subunit